MKYSNIEIFKLLKELSKSGKCVIVASHSNKVKKYADKVLKLKDSKLIGEKWWMLKIYLKYHLLV